jgi:hypothetical protein
MVPLGRTLVFDDFYRDPDAVRGLALRGTWSGDTSGFRGLQCEPCGLNIPAIIDHVAALVGEPLRYHPSAQGRFRSLTESQEAQKTKQVHVDRAGFAGIVCLNAVARGATLLLRHRSYGVAHFEDVEHLAREIGATPAEVQTVVEQDACDLDQWEVVESLACRYNRLIIFNTNHYHVAAAGFGEDPASAKLTQNFNFTPDRTLDWRRRLLMRGRTRGAAGCNPY